MVATFARLKLAIASNRARQALEHPDRLILGVVVFIFFVGSRVAADGNAVVWLYGASTQPDGGAVRAVAAALFLSVGWMLFPLFGARRASLAVEPMLVLPLRPSQITTGLFVSGAIGPGALVTTGVLGVLAASYMDDASAFAVAVAASVALLVQVMVLGRMMASVRDFGVRSRHARAWSAAITLAVVAVGLVASGAANAAFTGDKTSSWYVTLARWSPPGLLGRAPAEAVAGQTAAAVAMIVGPSLATVALWALWVWVVGQRLEGGAPAGVTPTHLGDPFARFARHGPQNRVGAIAARERAMLFRSSHALLSAVVYVAVIGGVFGVLIASAAPDGYAPLGAAALAFPLTIRRVNQVAARATGRWLSVVSPGPRWADVAGFDLATAPFDAAIIVGTTGVLAGVTDSWDVAAPAAFLGIAVWLIGIAAVHVTSFRLAQPPSSDVAGDPGETTPSLTQTLVTIFGAFAALVPVGVMAVLGIADGGSVSLYLVVLVALGYSVGLWWATLRWTASWLDRHEADLQATLHA